MSSKEKTVSKPSKPKKQVSPAKVFILLVFKYIIIAFIAIMCAFGGLLGGAVYGYIKTAPLITEDQLQLKKFNTFIYDSKNTQVSELRGEENRVWVDDQQIPKYLKDAFVAIEDERFYDHKGIDFKRIGGAVITLFKSSNKSYGASTITQQVIKNLTGDDRRTLQRKVQEQWRAIQLEKKLEKWQILEMYMNLIYMGGSNMHGVQSASKAYFNKDVSQLTLAQCASLAGVTNLPGKYAPNTESGKKNNKQRQELVLKKMLQLKYITQGEYDKAINEDLHFVQGKTTQVKATSRQSYFVDSVVNDVKKDLMSQCGMSEQIALKTIYNNGLKIYTTMDSDLQKIMDSVYQDDKFFPIVNKNAEHPQSGMVIVDVKTGQVKAMYGGYGVKKADMTFNRAAGVQMQRQPGSSFKPIAVYGPAINEKIITAATVYDDAPVHFNGNNKPRYPENYDRSFGGLTNIHDAIRDSVNVVAAKVWNDLEKSGTGKSFDYIKRVGINRDSERGKTFMSIAMGGLQKGVNPLEMAAAYVPLANKGAFIEPTTYTKVVDKSGKVILEKKPKKSKAYEETSAFIMTNMMRDVCRLGTANPYGLLQDGNMPTAGKTGTTGDNKDKWFVGFSPYYSAATWYGYDTPRTLQSSEYNQALKIWHEVMERAHKNLKPVEFVEPQGLVKKDICIYSGKLVSNLCSGDPRGDAYRPGEYFIQGTEPTDTCDVHVSYKVCKGSKDTHGRNLLFGSNCPAASALEKVFIQRPEPFKPIWPDDPYPADSIYEAPSGEYCNIHGPGHISQTKVNSASKSN